MAGDGNQNTANRLRRLAGILAQRLDIASPEATREEYLNFLMDVLRAVSEDPSTQSVYPLLQQNLDLLDENLQRILEDWAGRTLPQAEEARGIAGVIANFSALMIDFPLGDRSRNVEIGIAGNKIALTVYTKEAFPQSWARTQNNLGNAYSNRIKGDQAENIEEAIAAYGQALSVYTFEAFPQSWAGTQNNLGTAYRNRIKGDKAENIEEAIAAYGRVLSVLTFEAFPQNWAMTQNNLGLAYSDRIKGDKAENIEEAIAAYGQDWASTQNNLGTAYSNRIKGDKAENIEEAIAAYGQALKVRTPQNFPLDCLQTGRNLGNIGFNNSNWQVAVEGYKLAIAAVEQSRNWAVREERRQEIIKESLDVYINIVQACINLGQLDKAIEYVERSRSQRLIDLMASNNLYRGGTIPSQVQEKLQKYEALQQEINGKRAHQSHDSQERQKAASGSTAITANSCQGRTAHNAYSEEIAGLEVQKQQVWEELRKLDFELAGQIEVSPPNLAAMQQLIESPAAAILSFYSTVNDTHIFILRQNQAPQVHTCTGQGYDTLQKWIGENWIQLYIEKDKTEWRHQMNAFLTELAQRLQLDVLISQHLGDIKELILVPHLYLHQIPFAALPINQPRECLIDKFILRTVPSCQILEFCHRRPPIEGSRSYGIVENATENLPYAAFECEQIVRMYGIPENQRLKGRQGATVENYRQLASRVHVLHSSHHAESRLDNPLESYLELGNGNITLGELMTPGWRLPNLEEVFLSCCETSFGVTEITDDIITIATGFLCAGARSVVGTLWAVSDIATAILCVYYYQQRHKGKSRPEALREAQVWLRKLDLNNWISDKQLHFKKGSDEQVELDKLLYSDKDPPCQHPYYWAGFCAVGL
ncbi:MAG: CHAT domain-containing protein [Hormoscilla sp. GM7CHS1pb]|nr:CHAT domain-containing protein [Hormoscilla sp. GM7CHS1pb]